MLFQSKRNAQPIDPRVLHVAGGSVVDRTIARLNIEHFRKRLSEETDEIKRRVIRGLLQEEEAKLASLDEPAAPNEKDE